MNIRAIHVDRQSDAGLLHLGEQILTNSQSSQTILKHLSGYGFESEDFDEGQERHDVFSAMVTKYQRLKGHETTRMQERDTAHEAFHDGLFRQHVNRARLAFEEDEGVAVELSLEGLTAGRYSLGEWIVRSRRFYDILLNDAALLSAYGGRGGESESLQVGREAVEDIADLQQQYVAKRSEREQTRRIRDEKRRKLEAWIRSFQRTAKFALESEADLLQQVGFQVTD